MNTSTMSSCESLKATPPTNRKRFTREERQYITRLVEAHKQVLENPELNSASLEKKNKTWLSIHRQFNSIPSHTQRTVKQLRKAWDNHKSRLKALDKSRQNTANCLVEEEIVHPKEEVIYFELSNDSEHINDVVAHTDDTSAENFISLKNISELQEELFVDKSANRISDSSNVEIQKPPTPLDFHSIPSVPPEVTRNRPRPRQMNLSRKCGKVDVLLGHNPGLLRLVRREMLIHVEIAEIERKKAEAELGYREEEQEYKRRMWELELKIMEKRLRD